MNELTEAIRKDPAVWEEQDAHKAAQIATSIGKAALDMAMRAKDMSAIEQAATAMMTQQHDFVVWWDGQEKDRGGHASLYAGCRSATGIDLDQYGLHKSMVSRWRKRLTENGKESPDKLETAIFDAVEKCSKHLIAGKISDNHRAEGTGENEWYTPVEYLDAARNVLGGFDLDPASSQLANETVQAKRFFTIHDDGLAQNWSGRIWMNPPYAQPHIQLFCEKLAEEYGKGDVNAAIALTHNYTDTAWFHRLADACSAICFTKGRIGFINTDGEKAAPTQGQAFFYLGADASRFASVFNNIGFVMKPDVF